MLTLETNLLELARKKLRIISLVLASFTIAFAVIFSTTLIRSKIIEARINRYTGNSSTQFEDIDKNSTSSKLTTFFSLDFCKIMNDQFLEDYFIIYISLSLTMFIYIWNAVKSNARHEYWCKFSRNRIDKETETNFESDNRCLSLFFRVYRLMNLRKLCGIKCTCGIEFPVPINPFSKHNRFITSVIYAAYTYNILKIFEFLLIGDQTQQYIESKKNILKSINTSNLSLSSIQNSIQDLDLGKKFTENGILMELLKQICNVFIIGFRYYPVLLCVELKRKSKISYLFCTIYVVFLLFYYVYMNMFCLLSAYNTVKSAYETIDTNRKSQNFPTVLKSNFTSIGKMAQNKSRFLGINVSLNKSGTFFDGISAKNFTTDLKSINSSLFVSNFMYEKFVFYAVLVLISFYMISEFVKLMGKYFTEKRMAQKNNCVHCKPKRDVNVNVEYSNQKVDHEIKYTKELFKPKIRKPISFSKYLFEKYIYKNRRDFRYTKQFINTHIIAFILLYYITCLIIRKSNLIVSVSSNLLILAINFIFKANDSGFMVVTKNQINRFVLSLYENISEYIVFAACFSTAVYVVQLFIGIKSYHRHVLNAYKGVYVDIPSPKRFSNVKMASSSLHYR